MNRAHPSGRKGSAFITGEGGAVGNAVSVRSQRWTLVLAESIVVWELGSQELLPVGLRAPRALWASLGWDWAFIPTLLLCWGAPPDLPAGWSDSGQVEAEDAPGPACTTATLAQMDHGKRPEFPVSPTSLLLNPKPGLRPSQLLQAQLKAYNPRHPGTTFRHLPLTL